MESTSSDYSLTFLRPFAAILFVLSFILIGRALAWKLVLVHVPLVQDIFGLKKKQFKPKPRTGAMEFHFHMSEHFTVHRRSHVSQ